MDERYMVIMHIARAPSDDRARGSEHDATAAPRARPRACDAYTSYHAVYVQLYMLDCIPDG